MLLHAVVPEAVWQANPKYGMVAPYQSDEIWAVDSQKKIIKIVANRCQILRLK